VKGPDFIALHELFDKVADELEEFTDDIAERAVELGGVAQGTVQDVSKHTRLAVYPLDLAAGKGHILEPIEGESRRTKADRRNSGALTGESDGDRLRGWRDDFNLSA
jgi:starvation-inducible DNA-binding protein